MPARMLAAGAGVAPASTIRQGDHMRRNRFIAALTVAGTIAAGASATPALAVTDSTCRASALRTQLLTLVQEPVVANPAGSPCYTSTSPAATMKAETTYNTDGYYSNAQAHAFYGSGAAALPGVLELAAATTFESYADVSCYAGGTAPSVYGWSYVNDLQVRPSVLAPPIVIDGSTPQTIPISGVGTLYVNREIKTAKSVTRQALFLDTATVDTVIGESKAAMTC
jgi:hypothetical protein